MMDLETMCEEEAFSKEMFWFLIFEAFVSANKIDSFGRHFKI